MPKSKPSSQSCSFLHLQIDHQRVELSFSGPHLQVHFQIKVTPWIVSALFLPTNGMPQLAPRQLLSKSVTLISFSKQILLTLF